MLKNYGREILASAKASGFAFDRDRDRSGNAKRMRKLTSTACALNLQTFSRINLIQQRRGYRPRRSFLAKQNATSETLIVVFMLSHTHSSLSLRREKDQKKKEEQKKKRDADKKNREEKERKRKEEERKRKV